MDLIKSPWADVFSEFGRSVQTQAILAAPFIGPGPLADLASFFDSANPPRVELITNLAVDSLLQGTVDRVLSLISAERFPKWKCVTYPAFMPKCMLPTIIQLL